jgi:hypothetical protein
MKNMREINDKSMREKDPKYKTNVGLIIRCIMECGLFTEIKELN